jgi:hypothetical protein
MWITFDNWDQITTFKIGELKFKNIKIRGPNVLL